MIKRREVRGVERVWLEHIHLLMLNLETGIISTLSLGIDLVGVVFVAQGIQRLEWIATVIDFLQKFIGVGLVAGDVV